MDVDWERADDIGRDLLGIVKFEIIEIVVCACLRKCVMDLLSKTNSCSKNVHVTVMVVLLVLTLVVLKRVLLSIALDYGYVFTR